MAWGAEDAQARARSVPPGTWARNLLVARRAKAGSRDREEILFKLTSCKLRLVALWAVVRPKTTKTTRPPLFVCGVVVLF